MDPGAAYLKERIADLGGQRNPCHSRLVSIADRSDLRKEADKPPGYDLGRLKTNSDSKCEINSQPSFPSEFRLTAKSGLIFVLIPLSPNETNVPP